MTFALQGLLRAVARDIVVETRDDNGASIMSLDDDDDDDDDDGGNEQRSKRRAPGVSSANRNVNVVETKVE